MTRVLTGVLPRALHAALVLAAIALPASAHAADKWVTSWIASAQGPYPVGNPSAQPVLKFAFPTPEAGASDQTFRLVLMPDIWGKQTRVRFTNVFGVKPLTIDGAYAGLQLGSALFVQGFFPEAADAFERALALGPDDASLRRVLEGQLSSVTLVDLSIVRRRGGLDAVKRSISAGAVDAPAALVGDFCNCGSIVGSTTLGLHFFPLRLVLRTRGP